ncbi:Heat shock protein SSE1 [Intoshia linei]|uniref:Heat shock protein SSE1 n=1 Tax=Intoshia linei TaxID=1819745 RepID=A0A177B380_9BILA|nr:Heat shock protein SSE1 [Intoshia linei]
MSVVGFDFGYSQCAISIVKNGTLECVTNESSERLTSNVISFSDKRRFMGPGGLSNIKSNLINSVFKYKYLIGYPLNHAEIQKYLPFLPYSLVSNESNTISIKVNYFNRECTFTIVQIIAMMLTKLKQITENYTNLCVSDVVISVPNYFTDIQRRCMLTAAKIANINCLRLMNDTTAIATCYGFYRQDFPAVDKPPKKVIMMDYGENSLQICAVEFNKDTLKIVAADHGICGGHYITLAITRHFIKQLKDSKKITIKEDSKSFYRLYVECEKLKRRAVISKLSTSSHIDCLAEGQDVDLVLDVDTVYNLSAKIFEKVEQVMQNILVTSDWSVDSIDDVELIGGSSRIPYFKEIVAKVFKKQPNSTNNLDEAISRGCALQCAILSTRFKVKEYNIFECQPYSISVKYPSSDIDTYVTEIFQKNCTIPASKLITSYNTAPFSVDAFYTNPTEHMCQEKIASFDILDVVPTKDDMPSRVKLKLRINKNGIFVAYDAKILVVTEEMVPEEKPKEIPQKKDVKMKDVKDESPKESDSSENTTEESLKEDTDMKDVDVKPEVVDVKPEVVDSEMKDVEKKEVKMIKKLKNKLYDLKIKSKIHGPQFDDINLLVDLERNLINKDADEIKRQVTANALESSIYEMRSCFGEDKKYDKFTPKKVTTSILKLCNELENWYFEYFDYSTADYADRHANLNNLAKDSIKRHDDHKNRPELYNTLSSRVHQLGDLIARYESGEEQFNHLKKEDVDKVKVQHKTFLAWFEKSWTSNNKMDLSKDPIHWSIDIEKEIKAIENTSLSIMTQAKPKPPLVTPKDDKETKDEDTKKEETTDQKENGDVATQILDDDQKSVEMNGNITL